MRSPSYSAQEVYQPYLHDFLPCETPCRHLLHSRVPRPREPTPSTLEYEPEARSLLSLAVWRARGTPESRRKIGSCSPPQKLRQLLSDLGMLPPKCLPIAPWLNPGTRARLGQVPPARIDQPRTRPDRPAWELANDSLTGDPHIGAGFDGRSLNGNLSIGHLPPSIIPRRVHALAMTRATNVMHEALRVQRGHPLAHLAQHRVQRLLGLIAAIVACQGVEQGGIMDIEPRAIRCGRHVNSRQVFVESHFTPSGSGARLNASASPPSAQAARCAST